MIMREAKNADSEEIKKLMFQVLEEYGIKPKSESAQNESSSIESQYHLNGGYFAVVESGKEIVATLGLFRLNNNTCELRKMYALPQQRGKGLGRELMDFSLQKAKELGFSRMILETASPLVEAIALYRKYGFKEYKPEHLTSSCDMAFEILL